MKSDMQMLKQVQYLDYDTEHAYSLMKRDAVINLMDIVSILSVERSKRMPFDDVVRIRFVDGSAMYAIGKPEDFMKHPKQGGEEIERLTERVDALEDDVNRLYREK